MTEQQIKSLIVLQQTLVTVLHHPDTAARDGDIEMLENNLVDALYHLDILPQGVALHYAMIRGMDRDRQHESY